MSMEEWAKREIEIAKKRERGDNPGDEWDYGCACYDSAYKAFMSLLEDGHSGMSISITKSILNRLIDGKPLTPIADTDDIWNLCNYCKNNEYITYQCKRMSALFKKVYSDGRVEYSSLDRCYCKNIHSGRTYSGALARRIINEMYPITMPYMPGDSIEVGTDDFLTDPKNEDFDTVGIFYAIVNGEKIEINRFFAESRDYTERDNQYFGWVEITKEEYDSRSKKADILRVMRKKDNCKYHCGLYSTCQKKEEYQYTRACCDDFICIE